MLRRLTSVRSTDPARYIVAIYLIRKARPDRRRYCRWSRSWSTDCSTLPRDRWSRRSSKGSPRHTGDARGDPRAVPPDDPFIVQYWRWITHAVVGDFGDSIVEMQPVTTVIGERLAISATLALMAIVIVLVTAIPLGHGRRSPPGQGRRCR